MTAGQLILLLVLNLGAVPVYAWDVAVAVGNKIHFLEASGTVVGSATEEGIVNVRTLEYNTELNKMYFSDDEREDGSIFSMTVPKPIAGNHTVQVNTLIKEKENVMDMAYDEMTGILYWSNGRGHSIKWMRVNITDKPQSGQLLISTDDQVIMGIAIDNCKRYLYWTNSRRNSATIERALLDGSNQETLVNNDLYQPNMVVVDQTTDRLYWVDELPGIRYKVESVDLNGKDRRVVVEGSDHQPFALAVSAGQVFWADHIKNDVWRQDLDHPSLDPIKVGRWPKSPLSIVSAYSGKWTADKCNPIIMPVKKVIPATITKIVTHTTQQPPVNQETNCIECFYGGVFSANRGYCDCQPGYSGERCEIDNCLDFCVHGTCRYGTQGRSCVCQKGYGGERCENSLCNNFCVTGTCSIDLTGKPQCHCQEGYSGDRCEINFTEQQELKDKLQQVCSTYCKLRTLHAPQDEIEPYEFCSCIAPSQQSLEDTESGWKPDYTIVALVAVCSILLVVIAALGKRVLELRRRPRIKKRIIVNKNANQPLTSRPTSPSGDQCEITIENCCNMNICETPCFEPDFRQPHSSHNRPSKECKEEKKGLLGNMELPPDDLY